MAGNEGQMVRLRGVIFRCTIRAGHGSFAIIVSDEEDGEHPTAKEHEERMVLVVVRFGGAEWGAHKSQEKMVDRNTSNNCKNEKGNETAPLMRSNIKRLCKLGNEMEFRGYFANSSTSDEGAPIGEAQSPKDSSAKDWQSWTRFIVDYYLPSAEQIITNVRVCQELKWDSTQCQAVRSKYFASPPNKQKQKQQQKQIKRTKTISEEGSALSTDDDETKESTKRRHGGGIGKRKQGEIVSDFLLWMLSTIYYDEENDEAEKMPTARLGRQNEQSTCDDHQQGQSTSKIVHEGQGPHTGDHVFINRLVPLHPSLVSSDASIIASRNVLMANMITKSNNTTTDNSCKSGDINTPSPRGGIIDAAGGAGHVSLALALRGVHSTVVDPRSNVGKLPGRDRKVLKKSKKESFSTYRAWFGSRPTGVDSFFREGNISPTNASDGYIGSQNVIDPTSLPICSMCSEDNLLANCKAIIALHPDEATGVIVETAVKHEIPFVVVPCCVFSRLFPDRIKPNVVGTEDQNHANAIVSTYYDLIDWLVAMHPAIKVTRLPFDGANLAVWATFK